MSSNVKFSAHEKAGIPAQVTPYKPWGRSPMCSGMIAGKIISTSTDITISQQHITKGTKNIPRAELLCQSLGHGRGNTNSYLRNPPRCAFPKLV